MARPGRGAGSAEALRPLWQGASRVIFNGDTAETRAKRYLDASTLRIEETRRAAEADGVELTLIAGNHDPFVSEVDWLSLAGGRIVATHGDLLHPAIAPWSDEDGVLRRLHDQEVQRTATEHHEPPEQLTLEEQAEATKRAAARHWRQDRQQAYQDLTSSWIGRRARQARTLGKVLYYWIEMPRRAQRFAEAHFPECRFLHLRPHPPPRRLDRSTPRYRAGPQRPAASGNHQHRLVPSPLPTSSRCHRIGHRQLLENPRRPQAGPPPGQRPVAAV